MKLFVAGLSLGLALGVVAVWIAQGQHSATLHEEMVELTKVSSDSDCAKDKEGEYPEDFDPEFCIETKREPTKVFKIGLFDFALPAAGVLSVLTATLLFLNARTRRDHT